MESNAAQSVAGVNDLFNPLNKASARGGQADIGNEMPEFESTLTNDEIKKLVVAWETDYASYEKKVADMQDKSTNYWLGLQFDQVAGAQSNKLPLTDNKIFEALETFLPIATRANPECVVYTDNTPEGVALSKDVRNMLTFQADRQKLRMILKEQARQWALKYLGVIKVGWNPTEDDIETRVVLTENLIMDKDAYIEVGGHYTGEYLGEKRITTARKLSKMFPKSKPYIEKQVNGKMSTKVTYKEWWTKEDLFFTFKQEVLGKFKNPHWNYDGEVERPDPETGETMAEMVKGKNHFPAPEIPYIFLAVFSNRKQPHDPTSLIWQNISIQDLINKRYKQIDRNVDSMNNGIVLSGKSFTKEQAAEAANQLAKGNALWVPSGDIAASYRRDQAPSLSGDVFFQLKDARDELSNIFGVRGSSAQGIATEKQVRGKIMANQADSSRIGGGITDYLEQVADTCYNWWVQLMFVYYDEPHTAAIIGTASTQEFVSLRNTDLNRKIIVTVKEGSLIPKDTLTQRNEAMDLWEAKLIDPITALSRLDFPDPQGTALKMFLWQTNPMALFPELQQQQSGAPPGQAGGQPGQAQPPEQPQVEVQAEPTGQKASELIKSVPIK